LGSVVFDIGNTTNQLYENKSVSVLLISESLYLRFNISITANETANETANVYWNDGNEMYLLLENVTSEVVTEYLPSNYSSTGQFFINDTSAANCSFSAPNISALYNTLHVVIQNDSFICESFLYEEPKVFSLGFNNTNISTKAIELLPARNNSHFLLRFYFGNVSQSDFETSYQLVLQQGDDLNFTNTVALQSLHPLSPFQLVPWFGTSILNAEHFASNVIAHVTGGFDSRYNYSCEFEQLLNSTLPKVLTSHVAPRLSTSLDCKIPEVHITDSTFFFLATVYAHNGTSVWPIQSDINATALVFFYGGKSSQKVSSGLLAWQIALIIVGGVLGAAAFLVILIGIYVRTKRNSYSPVK